jgi:AhpD family alkylhydroperoxidase
VNALPHGAAAPVIAIVAVVVTQETSMYRIENLQKFKTLGALVPKSMGAFQAFDGAALEAGTIPKKYKELIALGVALTTQCAYCLEVHRDAATQAGATPAELAEVVYVAAALRAGAAMTHGTHLIGG